MNPFDILSPQENEELLKFPAYISILAAHRNDKLDEAEKISAIKFAHTKTFTCDPLLVEYYKEADLMFENTIASLDKSLPKEPKNREIAIKTELKNLERITLKLGSEYAKVMHKSMESFTKHVSKAHHNVLEDFIFPIPIAGLTY
jgi:hypothetical protein